LWRELFLQIVYQYITRQVVTMQRMIKEKPKAICNIFFHRIFPFMGFLKIYATNGIIQKKEFPCRELLFCKHFFKIMLYF
jgi:hypothetical protein